MENKNVSNQTKTENTASGIDPIGKVNFMDMSVKETFADPEVQKSIRRLAYVPQIVTVKKARNPFENKDTKSKTQKIEVMSGTTIEDAVSFELTLLDTELDPVAAINKKFRIIDYTLGLSANMKGKDFLGYAATGLKLTVTRLEEVK